MSSEKKCLATLVAQVRDPLDRAVAILDAGGDEREIRAAVHSAIEAAGFARHGTELIPLPGELTDLQRDCAEVLAGHDGLPIFNGWALPDTTRKLRRYLNPPRAGVLERMVKHEWEGQSHSEPLWRAFLRHDRKPGTADTFFRGLGLPLSERLEVFGDIFIGAYNINRFGLTWGDPSEIDGTHGRWAVDMARSLMEGRHGTTDQAIKVPVFLALVRAGAPIEPEWDQFLFAGEHLIEPLRECADALPASRREAALTRAIASLYFSSAIVRVGLDLLQSHPSPSLVALVLANADGAAGAPKSARVTRTELKKRMKVMGEHHPLVAEAWGRYERGLPVPIHLTSRGVLKPSKPEDLTDTQQRQMIAFGKMYDGRELSLEERFDPDTELDEGSVAGFLDIDSLLEPVTGHCYDVFLVVPDSGSVFVSGTIQEVACIIQGAVECEDVALRDALRAALKW